MPQLAILNGIYTDQAGDFRTAYPRNLQPVPKAQGISEGYLRPAEGIASFTGGYGVCRGGIIFQGRHFRMMGDYLIEFTDLGVPIIRGVPGGTGHVQFDYSFDRIAFVTNNKLYYHIAPSGPTIPVIDPDISNVIDVVFVDGYFLATDGEFIIQTELSDPTQVNPLKYGSAESDPDPIVALLAPRNELTAIGRYTIEQFQNVGGDGFAFQRIEGARISKGAVGTSACCLFQDAIALVGGGRNEPNSVYLAFQGSANKIATREIETILEGYTEEQLSVCLLETRSTKVSQLLYIHLPDQTLVYDAAASAALQVPVWFVLTSTETGLGQYRGQNWLFAYGKWTCGDTQGANVGIATDTVATHFESLVGWEFSTNIIYSEGKGAILSELEMVALPGRVRRSANPVVWTSYSLDGVNFSTEMAIGVGKQGEYDKRLVWRRLGFFKNWRIQRFRGNSDSQLSIARLELTVDSLYG